MLSLDRIVRSLCLSTLIATGCSLPAGAAFVVDKTTTLTGSGNVGQLTVYSLVTSEAATGSVLYNYSYAVTYNQGQAAIHVFGIGNPNDCPYSTAANTPADGSAFANPAYQARAGLPFNIEWTGDVGKILEAGQTRTFSYQSFYAPQAIDVYCYAVDGGAAADGGAIGMGPLVPEPGSILALACGIVGLVPRVIRRRKRGDRS